MNNLNFQYCQKIVVFNEEETQILLCKRKGEADYDGIYSFIGGKMESNDKSIIEGLKREKNEEVGKEFKVKIYPNFSNNLLFNKKDGSTMILPHYFAKHVGGEINLNEEYSKYKRIEVDQIENFEPKIPTIVGVLDELKKLRKIIDEKEMILI